MGLSIPILWTSHHFLLSFPFLFITGAQLFYFFRFIPHEINPMCYFFEPWAVINFEPQQRLQKTDNPSRDWQVRLKVVNVWNRDNQKALMEGEVDGMKLTGSTWFYLIYISI